VKDGSGALYCCPTKAERTILTTPKTQTKKTSFELVMGLNLTPSLGLRIGIKKPGWLEIFYNFAVEFYHVN
jgi:hypothetical protein